jgi:transcriptional regulator with XRE-family HTH domain
MLKSLANEQVAQQCKSMTSKETLCDRIQRLIKQAGLNQTAFSAKTGIERTQLSRALAGSREFKQDELGWVASALGLTLPELLEGLEMPPAIKAAAGQASELVSRTLEAERGRALADERAAQMEQLLDDERVARAAERQSWETERARFVRDLGDAQRRAGNAESATAAVKAQLADERARGARALETLRAEANKRLALLEREKQAALARVSEVEKNRNGQAVLAALAGLGLGSIGK